MPAHLVPLVEVVCAEASDPASADDLAAFMRATGKVPVIVRKDLPGFLANRLQHALAREAYALIDAGVATAADVDAAVRFGFGFRYLAAGPILQKDHAGLDVHAAAAATMYPSLAANTVPSTTPRRPRRRRPPGDEDGRGLLRLDAGDDRQGAGALRGAAARGPGAARAGAAESRPGLRIRGTGEKRVSCRVPPAPAPPGAHLPCCARLPASRAPRRQRASPPPRRLDGRLKKIADTKTITLAYRTDAAPFSFADDKNQPTGYTVDLCKRVATLIEGQLDVKDLQVKWVPVTSQNRFDAVAKGQADLECGASTVTLARMKQVDFSQLHLRRRHGRCSPTGPVGHPHDGGHRRASASPSWPARPTSA